MPFMMITKERPQSYSDTMDAESAASMMKYMESLQKAGVLLAFAGLRSPALGAKVSFPCRNDAVQLGTLGRVEEARTECERAASLARNPRGRELLLNRAARCRP